MRALEVQPCGLEVQPCGLGLHPLGTAATAAEALQQAAEALQHATETLWRATEDLAEVVRLLRYEAEPSEQEPPPSSAPTTDPRALDALIDAAAMLWNVSRSDLLGPRRHRKLVDARRAVAVLAYRAGYAQGVIGAALHRDRSTVVHACQTGNASSLLHARLDVLTIRWREVQEREVRR